MSTPELAVTLTADQVQEGDTLPEVAVPITRTLIVASAIASRDYQDVHHDPGLAQERGSPDIFMNILTSNGLVERYVADWAGPAAVITKIKVRLGAPNYPGDTMVLTGSVEDVADGRVSIAVTGQNALGPHVTGTVMVQLPQDRSASAPGGPTGGTA